jgi:hypothetical protein
MHPDKAELASTNELMDLPNVGPAIAQALESIGIRAPGDLVGCDPLELYEDLCRKREQRQDPCVLDVFMSITDFMNGNSPRTWWAYTAERKRRYGRLDAQRSEPGSCD